MVELGGDGSDNFTVQLPSTASVETRQVRQPMGEALVGDYHLYPPPLNTYEEVVSSRELFMDTLKKLHSEMGTKFKIPIVGGRDLDMYQLFLEVTSRGGISKVLKERKWKEVTAVFTFPLTATNASFILRKYYISLIYHYEQVYFFKAKRWAPVPSDAMNHSSMNVSSTSQPINTAGSQVHGVIDGKFESGYLITVRIGSEDFKGVLYQVPSTEPQISYRNVNNHNIASEIQPGRRKRRKKSEMRKRDPAHPKPNRSGYNFFFAEQHARLKPHNIGRDREISRMIGEQWSKLHEPERAVYQEKAIRDKERYRVEMEKYREQLKTGNIIQQNPPVVPEVNLIDFDLNLQNESSGYGKSEDAIGDEEWDLGVHSRVDMEVRSVNVEILPDDEASFKLQTSSHMNGGCGGDQDESKSKSSIKEKSTEDDISVPIANGDEQISN